MNRRVSRLITGWMAILGAVRLGAADLTRLSFQLDWHPNAQFAGLLLAQHRGWYRDAGIEVTFVPVDTEMKVVATVTSGGAWLGCSESGVLIAARAGGAPIRVLGTMLQGSPMGLLSLRAQGFNTLKKLRGHRIGIHPDGRKALELVLAHDGLKPSDFTIVEKEHDLTPLLNGDCDAVQGYSIDEAVALQARGTAIDFLPFHEHGYRAYSQVYFGAERFVKEHRDLVTRFLEVSNRGWRAAILDPGGSSRIVVEQFAPTLDRDYQRRSLEAVGRLAILETGIDGLGRMRPETWNQALANFSRWQVVTPALGDSWIDYTLIPPPPRGPPGKAP